MARDPEVTQLPLFGDDDWDDGSDFEVRRKGLPGHRSWEEVARDLGLVLRETRFEAFLAKQEEITDSPDEC